MNVLRHATLPGLFLLAACSAGGIRVIKARAEGDVARVSEIRSTVSVEAFEAGTFTRDGRAVRYRLLRPSSIVEGRRYPMVVIFHGSGAIGTDNTSQIGPLAKSWATPLMSSRYPAFVLVPQFSDRSSVYEGMPEASATSRPTQSLRDALELIVSLHSELPVERRKVVAIGFSMGGSAVWNALVLKPGLFSSAAIVAGVPNRDALSRLGSTRLLLIHGDADRENPFAAALAAYRAAPKHKVEFWQYESLGHDFPADLIAGTDLAEWLLRTGAVPSK
jgi:predicted peptidase